MRGAFKYSTNRSIVEYLYYIEEIYKDNFETDCTYREDEKDEEENIAGFSKRKRAVAHFSVRGKLDYFPSKFGISFWI